MYIENKMDDLHRKYKSTKKTLMAYLFQMNDIPNSKVIEDYLLLYCDLLIDLANFGNDFSELLLFNPYDGEKASKHLSRGAIEEVLDFIKSTTIDLVTFKSGNKDLLLINDEISIVEKDFFDLYAKIRKIISSEFRADELFKDEYLKCIRYYGDMNSGINTYINVLHSSGLISTKTDLKMLYDTL